MRFLSQKWERLQSVQRACNIGGYCHKNEQEHSTKPSLKLSPRLTPSTNKINILRQRAAERGTWSYRLVCQLPLACPSWSAHCMHVIAKGRALPNKLAHPASSFLIRPCREISHPPSARLLRWLVAWRLILEKCLIPSVLLQKWVKAFARFKSRWTLGRTTFPEGMCSWSLSCRVSKCFAFPDPLRGNVPFIAEESPNILVMTGKHTAASSQWPRTLLSRQHSVLPPHLKEPHFLEHDSSVQPSTTHTWQHLQSSDNQPNRYPGTQESRLDCPATCTTSTRQIPLCFR